MLCYKDTTFCTRRNCANTECPRNLNRSDFKPDDMSVAYAGFQHCKDFKEKNEVQRTSETAGRGRC